MSAMCMKKRKSNEAFPKKAKKRKKHVDEAAAKIQEVVNNVPRHASPSVNNEVIELAVNRATPDSADDSLIHELLKLEAGHVVKPVVGSVSPQKLCAFWKMLCYLTQIFVHS